MSRMRSRGGAVSIQALWLLLIVSFLAVGLAMRSSLNIGVTKRSLETAGSEFMARSLAKIARDQIAAADSLECEYSGRCVTMPEVVDVEIDGDTFCLRLLPGACPGDSSLSGTWDEESRINLHTAPRFVLENLFNDPMQVERIIQYRRGLRQVQTTWTKGADSLCDPASRRALFGKVDDLLLFESFTVEDLKLLRPYLTAFGAGHLNINTASPEVLAATGCPQSLIDKLLEIREHDGATEGQSGHIFRDWELLPGELLRRGFEISTEEQNWIKAAHNHSLIGARSEYFSFHVICNRNRQYATSGLSCLVRRIGGNTISSVHAAAW